MTRIRICTLALGFVGLAALAGCGAGVAPEDADRFRDRLGDTSVTVFPACVRKRDSSDYDAPAADKLAEFIREAKLGAATITDVHVPIPGGWHIDESRMFRESRDAFAAYLREHPIDTEYALLAEYLCGPSEVGAVHCYILDKQGKPAHLVGMNSHHKPFADADPKTADDATQLLIRVLRDELSTVKKEK